MNIILFNLAWMSFNIFLATVPVVFGVLMLKNKSVVIRLLSGFIWLIFLPNTLYLLTDIIHFFEDLRVLEGAFLGLDLLMYFTLMILGVTTFTLSLYPFEKLIHRGKSKKNIRRNIPSFFILNFLIGFGMVLGRIHGINSWEVFTDIEKVIVGSITTASSFKLMLLAILFASLCQLIYSTFAKVILKDINWK